MKVSVGAGNQDIRYATPSPRASRGVGSVSAIGSLLLAGCRTVPAEPRVDLEEGIGDVVECVAGDDLLATARRPRAACRRVVERLDERVRERVRALGATSRPVVPSRSTSAEPPTAVATTGTAHAIASSSAIGIPSVRDGSTATSAARTYGATSATGPGR